ncbi:MAG: thiolase C-terminal domain-containing protein [Candidatus Promineifilaceae bacterium]
MRPVSIVGIGQIPVKKAHDKSLRQMAAEVVKLALEDAALDRVDALYASNMLADEMQCQKHVAALVADEAGLTGIEALQVRAAMASGAATLRMAYLAVGSGAVELALAVGVEQMSGSFVTPLLAKALDAQVELPDGETLVSQNARLMQAYFERYAPPADALAHFPVIAHENARHNPNALFSDRQFTTAEVLESRLISAPIRLLDCSPICDGAAAVILAPTEVARRLSDRPVQIMASAVATDRFRIADRRQPLLLEAVKRSAEAACRQADIKVDDVDFLELHDAFSIMACLTLEALGYAEPGTGWQLAANGQLRAGGVIPVTTMGGLKARGHPIGATGIYQACEAVLQLTGQAGGCQVPSARVGMLQSVGGVATTVVTHILAV